MHEFETAMMRSRLLSEWKPWRSFHLIKASFQLIQLLFESTLSSSMGATHIKQEFFA